MANARNIEAGGAYVRLFTEESGLIRGLRRAEKNFQAWGARMSRIGSFGGTGIASAMGLNPANVGLAGLAAGMTLSVKKFADMGSELNDLSSRTGESADALQKLSFAAKMTGSDVESLEVGIKKLGKNIGEALGGDKAANEMFRSLGLSAQQLSKMPLDKQFEVIADRLSRIPEGALRTKATMDLLGKSGTDLLPMLAGGGAELAAYGKRLEELGVIKTPQAIAAADDLGDRMDEVGLVLQHTAFVVGDALAPAVMALADNVIEIAKAANEWIGENEGVVTTVAMVAAGVGVAGVGLLALGAATHVVAMGFGAMATAAVAVASPIGLISVAAGTIGAVVVTQTNVGIGALEELETTAVSTWHGITDAVAGNDLALAGNIAMAGLDVAWQMGLAVLRDSWSVTWAGIEGVFDATIEGLQRKLLQFTEELTAFRFDVGIKIGLNTEADKRAGMAPVHAARQQFEANAAKADMDREEKLNQELLNSQKKVNAAQDRLNGLRAEAADKKAKAKADRDKKPSSKKNPRGDEPQLPDGTSGSGKHAEATTSGLAASLNRGTSGPDPADVSMAKLGSATEQTTRKIDEQTQALKRRNQAAEKPLFFAEPVPEAKKAAAKEKQAAKLAEAKATRDAEAEQRRAGVFGFAAQDEQRKQDERDKIAAEARSNAHVPRFKEAPNPALGLKGDEASKWLSNDLRGIGEKWRALDGGQRGNRFTTRTTRNRNNAGFMPATTEGGGTIQHGSPGEEKIAALDAKITDADANAKAFAGMAKDAGKPTSQYMIPQQNFKMPSIETLFGDLRMPSIDPRPPADVEQKLSGSLAARDDEKFDQMLDQLKLLNSNIRSSGVLAP